MTRKQKVQEAIDKIFKGKQYVVHVYEDTKNSDKNGESSIYLPEDMFEELIYNSLELMASRGEIEKVETNGENAFTLKEMETA